METEGFENPLPGSHEKGMKTLSHAPAHIKNTRVVCCTPETLFDVLSQLFLLHSFSTHLIKCFTSSLIKSLVHLNLTFDLLLI